MVEYEHTQIGTLMRIVFVGGAALFFISAVAMGFNQQSSCLIPLVTAVVFVICALLFHSLTVKVSHEEIRIRFGIGLIRKRIAVADVQSGVIVRNHWYYGWGVKLIPHGWLFNVSGFDAVEIQLKSGRIYRIGTDEPPALLSAIESVVGYSG